MKKALLFLFLTLNCISFSDVKFTKDEALSKALSFSKNGELNSIELEYYKKKPIWEIEIIDGNSKMIFKIDANNGKIISTKVNYEKKVQNNETDILSISEIKYIISKHVKHPIYTEISLDKNFGKKIYN
ncbi:PepSY domain-containing protein, partial [Streptobacillus felis]